RIRNVNGSHVDRCHVNSDVVKEVPEIRTIGHDRVVFRDVRRGVSRSLSLLRLLLLLQVETWNDRSKSKVGLFVSSTHNYLLHPFRIRSRSLSSRIKEERWLAKPF